MRRKLVMIGSGGHSRSCIDIIESNGEYELIGVIQEKVGDNQLFEGYPVLGDDSYIEKLNNEIDVNFAIGVGQIKSPSIRIKIFERLMARRFNLPNIISRSSYVSKRAKVGKGVFVGNFASIGPGAEIGDNCIINSMALVEHDAVVKSHSHVATRATLNGGSFVGEGCFVGSCSVLYQGTVLPSYSIIRAGSVVR